MNCLIAGVTGLVGSQALKLLLEDPRVGQVISVSRKSILPNPKLQQIIINFDSLDRQQLPQADVALCALGTTIKAAGSQDEFKKVDHDYVLSFARAAKRAGVQRFALISALGASADSRIFYNRVKGETERDLALLGFESLIILQPSLLLGERRESRPIEKTAVKMEPLLRKLFVGPLKIYQPVRASQVAKVMVKYALNPRFGSQTLSNFAILSSE